MSSEKLSVEKIIINKKIIKLKEKKANITEPQKANIEV